MDGGGHSNPAPPPADAAHHAPRDGGPVPAQEASRNANSVQGQSNGPPSPSEKDSSRITPRPTFLENLADSRDTQFMLHRSDSDDLDRYFVSQTSGALGDLY